MELKRTVGYVALSTDRASCVCVGGCVSAGACFRSRENGGATGPDGAIVLDEDGGGGGGGASESNGSTPSSGSAAAGKKGKGGAAAAAATAASGAGAGPGRGGCSLAHASRCLHNVLYLCSARSQVRGEEEREGGREAAVALCR